MKTGNQLVNWSVSLAINTMFLVLATTCFAQVSGPMSYVEQRPGAPAEHITCPDSLPCVTDSDFATFITATGWSEHFVIDHGIPTLPIAAGSPTRSELWGRVEEAVIAVFQDQGVDGFQVHCSLAGHMQNLLHVDSYITSTVPAVATNGHVPSSVSPDEANAQLTQAYQSIAYSDEPQRFFSEEVQSLMLGDFFDEPRLTLRSAWLSSSGNMSLATVAAVWSPESQVVYVLDLSGTTPRVDFDWDEHAREVETRIIEFLNLAGIFEIGVSAYSLCKFPTLTGFGEWIPTHFENPDQVTEETESVLTDWSLSPDWDREITLDELDTDWTVMHHNCQSAAQAVGYAVDQYHLANLQTTAAGYYFLHYYNPEEESSEDHFSCRFSSPAAEPLLLHEG